MNLESVGQSIALIIDESKPKSNCLLSIEPDEKKVINFMKELKLTDNR